MLRVDSTKPCKVVYSICKHDYFGHLIEPHVVQLNPDGDFSLTHQRLFSTTAREFHKILDETDLKLVKLLEEIEQGNIIKRFYKKAIRPVEFFTKVYDEKVHAVIRPKIERRIAAALTLLKDKDLFLMGREGWPVERHIEIASEPASVLFHFRRNEQETRYFPTIKYKGMRIEFMFRDAQIICNHPASLLLEDVLYQFEDNIEGKKFQPFLNKRYISIPRSSEKAYFEKFVTPLIEKHDVYAEGFEIRTEKYEAVPVLKVIYVPGGISQLQLYFKYGTYIFPAGSERQVTVRMEKREDEYMFHRVKRSLVWEKNKLDSLLKMGLKTTGALFINLEVDAAAGNPDEPGTDLFDWLSENHEELTSMGFEFEQPEGNKRFVFGSSRINLEFRESNDWFDIHAVVSFGNFQIPFIDLKHHILNRIKEFVLPSGEIAIIPDKWFSQLGGLLHFTEGNSKLRLKKHHIGLINDFTGGELSGITIERKLQKLNDFEEIEDTRMPVRFKGTLRSYQKAGYNWFHFLRKYRFGGCLADDMGLGKTVQTLALLQKIKEENELSASSGTTSLIIMPTSLIYNWLNEARKFAPDLRILVHTGTFRSKDTGQFMKYDIVFTTYGITRVDIDLLKTIYFNYIILDESQNIKNPSSKAYKAVKQLKSEHKLILSGTPVENSVNDLWTQMSFINPGLLGNQHYFQTEFAVPIEKKKDEERARKLQALIKPFVLRRTKSQVATELPEKTEQLFYCQMSDEQNQYYEKVKSQYRNEVFSSIENGTYANSQVQLLQGLTKLRQIANHPEMIDESYEGESGKFENVVNTLQNVLSRGHKVLVFSQFVKQLELYRRYFDGENIPYAYLDGATRNRGEVVEEFRINNNIRLFLISIKAGGVGLNLTEADYVFILDPWWNPAVEQQAVDRTHRIGQEKKVFIYKFITKDTVEEKILALQNRKKSVAESLITIEESFIKSLTSDDIKELLN